MAESIFTQPGEPGTGGRLRWRRGGQAGQLLDETPTAFLEEQGRNAELSLQDRSAILKVLRVRKEEEEHKRKEREKLRKQL
jgi:hypothetical protein